MSDAELQKMAEARLGVVLKGKYRLDRVLGIGGMATVYAATHRNKKKVAIKMLHPELSVRENIRTRFLREGYVANTVDHPGAVSVLDDDVAEDGSAFLVMELLTGQALDEVAAAEGGKLSLAIVVAIADGLLDVLANAHDKGIVHRDLKPANLFLTSDGRLEVLDFGIARLHDEQVGDATATAAGTMLGTPAFMAPEQALAESTRIDAQTDLWAVGATMFALLAGENVHDGVNASQLLVAAATKKARPVIDVAAEVPAPVAKVIDKALAFDKGDRWKSAKEMREALRAAYGGSIAALPKREPATLSSPSRASSDVGFEATVAAPSTDAPTPKVVREQSTTPSPVSRDATKPSEGVIPRKRRNWRPLIGIAAASAVIAGAALGYRAWMGPRVHLCLAVQEMRDGPKCAFEVGADVLAKRRAPLTRITTRGGKAVLVEHVNFTGHVDGDDYARAEIERDDSGAVTSVKKLDRYGAIVQWQKWSENGARVDYVDIDGKTPRRSDGRITTTKYEYDEQGRVKTKRHFGPTGRPRMDDDGAYGEAYEWTDLPSVWLTYSFLGADGKPAATPSGIASYHRKNDGTPWSDYSVFDIHGKPAMRKGSHIEKRPHDALEETGQAFFGLKGEPIKNTDQAFHELRITWDPGKRSADWIVYDEHGKPQPVKELWIWGLRRTYDDRGRVVLEEMLDGQGNLAINMNGWSAMRTTYDAEDHPSLYEQLGPSRALIQTIFGYAKRELKHDAHNNRLEVRYFDDAGKPTLWKEGAAVERATFDDRDLRLTRASFDGADKPTATLRGFASERTKYDHMRNRIELAFFDAEDKPTLSDDGFAMKRWTYDESDDLVAESYFDATGAPTPFQSQYAARKLVNDERGLVIEESFEDVHGDPTLVKAGYAKVKRARDKNGDVTEETFFGKHGEPVMREGGYAKKTTTYDDMRRPIEIALFDAAGQAVKGSNGWAIEKTTYDERGLVVRIDHFDAARSPSLCRDGRASIVRTNDARGNLGEETSLDVAGKPVATNEGYATKKSQYDDHDMVIEESFFAPDGSPIAGRAGWSVRRVRYDDFGKITEESFFDGKHEPVAPKGLSYASMRQRYDNRHLLVETSWFDARGAAASGPDGAAVVRYGRDSYGRATETSYFDGTNTPVASKDGKIVVKTTFDTVGHPTDEKFFDAQNAAHAASDGCAARHTKYDALGRKLEESCLDGDSKPILGTAGWAMRRVLHDGHGNDVEITTHAPDGSLHADKDGVARKRNRFDDKNLLVETTFFDVKGTPTHDAHGAWTIKYAYDDAGTRTSETALDKDGKALPPPGPR
jgi:serine/threonine-protein kinase